MENSDKPKLLWTPDQEFTENSNLRKYMKWLSDNGYPVFSEYHELWKWSVEHIEDFWKSLWDYFEIKSYAPYEKILEGNQMPHFDWFKGAKLNFAEHALRNASDDRPAIIFKQEGHDVQEISWEELKEKVRALQKYLKEEIGLEAGDRVVGFVPNSPEAMIGFLATASIGGVWSSCSPDFGISSVIDRFAQVEPKVFIAADGYEYGGKSFSKVDVVKEVAKALPSVKKVIVIPYLDKLDSNVRLDNSVLWDETTYDGSGELEFTPVDFSHPMWVLYSSGTTGIPKAITQSQGGILLEHLKYLTFHNNVKKGDRCFWYTTTGWMMWNYIQSSLLCGGTVVLYDGSPAYPNIDSLWQFAEEVKINHLGTSAGYIVANMKEGTNPSKDYDLSQLVSIGSTGSPLPPEGFDWIYDAIKKDLWLTSISGGTDVCSAFVGGNPLWPVYSGEIQCRALGCSLKAFDEDGNSLEDEVGEMVITKPMPSMPIYFWNDRDFSRYTNSYFEMYPGVWRHGDWTCVTPRKGIVIYGRSDATLNRGGVRIGTSEIYRAINKVKEIKDSMVISVEKEGGEFYMPLFVVLNEGIELDEKLIKKIKTTIREEYTPRHVPDDIVIAPEIPYTISGKKTETPVKKILMGKSINKSMNKDALKNPQAMDFFIDFASKLD